MKNLKVGDKVRCVIPFGVFQVGDEHELRACDLPKIYFMKHFEPIDKPLPPAVLVQNEREFKALMEDFNKRGWKPNNGYPMGELRFAPVLEWVLCELNNDFGFLYCEDNKNEYTVIPFSTYALIAGIEVPKEEITIGLTNSQFATFLDDRVDLDGDFLLSYTDLDKIITAYQSLKK